jgi:hypothetical protein
MKKVLKHLLFILTLVILSSSQTLAQLYEVSLEEKVRNSELIVQGQVQGHSRTVKDKNGDIFTLHKVKVDALLKGKLTNEFVEVITWGGETDEEIVTYSHFLTLHENDNGIFMLFNDANIEKFGNNIFSVYSDSQGFIEFSKTETEFTYAKDPFHEYRSITKDLFDPIEKFTDQKYKSINGSLSQSFRSGIRYNFKDITISESGIKFNIYVNSIFDEIKLYSSGIVLDYNTSAFGEFLIKNKKIKLTNEGISALSGYKVFTNDITSSKLKIEVSSNGNLGELITIGAEEQLLAIGEIAIANLSSNPDVTIDLEEMQLLNTYYANNAVGNFNKIIVNGNFQVLPAAPIIKTILPLIVSAGTDDVITITGTGFGATQGKSYVEFTNAYDGIAFGVQWFQPLLTDYVKWSDTEIIVRVPSIGLGVNFEQYAGTGKIRLKVSGFSIIAPTDVLTVKYAVDNRNDLNKTNPSRVKTMLVGDYGQYTGYTLYYDDDFKGLKGATSAFERALCTWVTTSKINFRLIKDTLLIPNYLRPYKCKISLTNTFPSGTSSSTRAKTVKDYSGCTNSSGGVIIATLKNFEIRFRKSENWYVQSQYDPTYPTTYWEKNPDFESFALHELGHAQLLLHSNNQDVMNWEVVNPRRSPKPNDAEGAKYIKNLSKISPNQCSSITLIDTLSSCGSTLVKEINNNISLIVYPNPTQDFLQIESDNLIEKIEIFDVVVVKVTEHSNINQNEHKISIENLLNGLYYVHIKTQLGSKTVKFQKI